MALHKRTTRIKKQNFIKHMSFRMFLQGLKYPRSFQQGLYNYWIKLKSFSPGENMLRLDDGNSTQQFTQLSRQWNYSDDGNISLKFDNHLNFLGSNRGCEFRNISHLNNSHYHIVYESRNMHDIHLNVYFSNGNSLSYVWWFLPWFYREMVSRSCLVSYHPNITEYLSSYYWVCHPFCIRMTFHLGGPRIHIKHCLN